MKKGMQKVVIVMDSFKGSLTSRQACQAVADGWQRAWPSCQIITLPASDGGDGLLEVWLQSEKGHRMQACVHDPLMHPLDAYYGISADGTMAAIEMASAGGLSLVPAEKRNPLFTTTYGVGELVAHALEHGCSRFIIGLGGSATNDAGFGMLQALGFRFLNHYGNPVPAMNGARLHEVSHICTDDVHPALRKAHFTLACDVQAPFCGIQGAAYVFAPQKGADASMVKTLDKGLQQAADVIRQDTGIDITSLPGTGAAGGMGGGLFALLGAEMKPGVDLVLDLLRLEEKIENACLIITGEGQSDTQTLMGKLPEGVLERSRKQGVPVLLVSGGIKEVEALNKAGFCGVFSTTPLPQSLKQAMIPATAYNNLCRTAEQLGRFFKKIY